MQERQEIFANDGNIYVYTDHYSIGAKGAFRARHMISELYNDETYYLQINSGTTFGPLNWDEKLIEMLHSCEAGEKAVITGITCNHAIEDNVMHHECLGL